MSLLKKKAERTELHSADEPPMLEQSSTGRTYTRDAYASMSRYLSRPRRKHFILLFLIRFRTEPNNRTPFGF
jgi:hypothetical protein